MILVCVCAAFIYIANRPNHKHLLHKKLGPVICIDPGHPSETNSARIMQNGTNELTMNWEVALKLASVLEKRYGVKTVMTKKSRDQFVRNHTRAIIGNESEADLTIHLHCDCGPSRGFTIYYPNRKGKLEGKEGPPPHVIRDSHKAAYELHDGMCAVLLGHLHDRGIKGDDNTRIGRVKGTLTVSAYSEVPTLTVEMVFLSSRHDAVFIKSEAGQEMMAQALAKGIANFLTTLGYKTEKGKFLNEPPIRR